MAEDSNETSGHKTSDFPSPESILDELNSQIYENKQENENYEEYFAQEYSRHRYQQLEYIELKGLEGHYKHKYYWSWFLMALMFCLVAFQSFLLGQVGAKIWDYSQYEWLLPLLLVQNFAQIVGLAVFVVRSLFSDMKKYK